MKDFYTRPQINDVILKDEFWSTYINNFRDITIPYCFEKFEETMYIQNFIDVSEKNHNKHVSFPFSDGLVLETITGASNFLASNYDKSLDQKLDKLIKIIVSAQEEDGFLCTMTSSDYPDKRWGENGGDIVDQHDLYNHGTLIEAGVAHYKATKKTSLIIPAIKAANLICSHIGEAPKHHVIPGHSLPEAAFLDLYRLLKTDPALQGLVQENNVNVDDYIEIVRFWYDNRGVESRRTLNEISKYTPERYQNTMPFGQMRQAMGHAVRAGLCYQGAASIYREISREDYKQALFAIHKDIITKKLHISGGVGSRADIEGFDAEYALQNDAYLETCAGIALSFFVAEMSLISKDSQYFDVFELSLYNNILGSMGDDFKRFYYDNPLVNNGTKNRWEWHDCPCCPPMLAKIYSSLASYIYSYKPDELCINMYLGSQLETDLFDIEQKDKNFFINIKNCQLKVAFRIPAYAQNFTFKINGKDIIFENENGYATIILQQGEHNITIQFSDKLCEICANPKVEADNGRICIMKGPILYCAEGADNDGNVDFTVAEKCSLFVHDDKIHIDTTDGAKATLIPYYQRNNRVNENVSDSKMAVWFKKENMNQIDTKEKLYAYYKIH